MANHTNGEKIVTRKHTSFHFTVTCSPRQGLTVRHTLLQIQHWPLTFFDPRLSPHLPILRQTFINQTRLSSIGKL